MNTSGRGERETETSRVARIYRAYGQSAHRRRAWAADNPGNRAMRDELRGALLAQARPLLAAGARVLDIGCGTGFWLAALRAAGSPPDRLTGVDLLPERVAAAEARVAGARLLEADARALPFDDDSFDVVLLFTTLSSLRDARDVERALLEAKRVLRPSGLLLCYEPRLPSPLNRRVRRIGPGDFDRAGISPRDERRLTLLPPLARRLGTRAASLYPTLARVPWLRSHRLIAHRKPEPG